MSAIQIDGSKLKNIFADKGLRPNYVALQMGYCDNYFYSVFCKNSIVSTVAKLLEMQYGIALDSYRQKTPEETKKTEVTPAPDAERHATDESLRQAVREGVLDALYQALSDNERRNQISFVLMNAYNGALTAHAKARAKGAK